MPILHGCGGLVPGPGHGIAVLPRDDSYLGPISAGRCPVPEGNLTPEEIERDMKNTGTW